MSQLNERTIIKKKQKHWKVETLYGFLVKLDESFELLQQQQRKRGKKNKLHIKKNLAEEKSVRDVTIDSCIRIYLGFRFE